MIVDAYMYEFLQKGLQNYERLVYEMKSVFSGYFGETLNANKLADHIR
jgi:hypothetical protein